MSVSHPHATGHDHATNWASSASTSSPTDHKIIGIQFLFSGADLLRARRPAGAGGALAARLALDADARSSSKWLSADAGGYRMPPEFYNMLFTHARHDHDLLRDHPAPDRGVRQLPDPADDRRPRHGVPEAEHDVVLVHVAGVRHASCTRFFVEGGAAEAGWTSYPTLLDRAGWVDARLAQRARRSGCWRCCSSGISSMMGSVNYITTIIMLRAPGMKMFRMPMTDLGHVHHRHPPGVRPAGADRRP